MFELLLILSLVAILLYHFFIWKPLDTSVHMLGILARFQIYRIAQNACDIKLLSLFSTPFYGNYPIKFLK